jgi:RND superfamily putative drug exporter
MSQIVGTSAPPHPSAFERLSGAARRWRWWAVLGWLVVLLSVTVASRAVGADYHNDFSLPGTESQAALDTLRERSPAQAGSTVQVVLADDGGLAAPGTRERVEAMLGRVGSLPHVAGVRSPYATGSGAVSADGTIGYATVTLDGQAPDVPGDAVRAIVDTARGAAGDGLRVELGGDAVRAVEEGEGGPAEGVGLLVGLVILVLMFGSLLAASLPIVVAIFAVGSAIGLLVLASHVATVADFTTPLMILVGLGVGIDYALLLFSRYRSELLAGATADDAARRALDTAGRTVLLAGLTVVVALLGLVVLGLGSLQGVAVAVALTVLATVLASLTLLPALLAITGPRVERSVRRRAARRGRTDGDRWRRWSALVQRRPWPFAAVAVAALLALAAPALDLRLGFADAGNDDPATTSRRAYDLLAEGFGPGFNGPVLVVAEGAGAAAGLPDALDRTPGVASVTPPIPSPDGRLATVIVFPDTKPQDEATHDLVLRLRSDVLPGLAGSTGGRYLVGGSTAATVDFADAVADRLPLFVAVVVGLSALLLLLVFRSVLIPLKAAVLNLLSIGAALGAVTLVFSDGAFGVPAGPVEAYVPVMIFALAFGLSMDYEMFLLARMREEWRRHGDATVAVREGVATTGGVVSAAGAIMVVVFGSFLLDPSRMLQQFGLGLAVAVLLDALVIRCLLLPAVMQLLGAHAWWLPTPLARRLPRVALGHR